MVLWQARRATVLRCYGGHEKMAVPALAQKSLQGDLDAQPRPSESARSGFPRCGAPALSAYAGVLQGRPKIIRGHNDVIAP